MDDWSDVPGNALLSLRRQARTGAREQWAIVPNSDGLVVQRIRPEDSTWNEAGYFRVVVDAVEGTPELRKLHNSVVSIFDLADQAAVSVHDFSALLDLCPQEDSDEPADWSSEELDACGWEDFELWQWAEELPIVRRLASVNGLNISGISDADECIPVLADEDGFVALDVPAEAGTFTHDGVSMVGWSGGSNLVVLAPGLACSVPWGDEIDSGENGFFLANFSEHGNPQQVATAIANWLTNIMFDFWAALVLEPLDPDGTLNDQGREAWTKFEDELLTVSPVLRIKGGIEPMLRTELARLSKSYARCAEARANPGGHVAQVMLASDQSDLHYGTWIESL